MVGTLRIVECWAVHALVSESCSCLHIPGVSILRCTSRIGQGYCQSLAYFKSQSSCFHLFCMVWYTLEDTVKLNQTVLGAGSAYDKLFKHFNAKLSVPTNSSSMRFESS